jgi:hypothetical protein
LHAHPLEHAVIVFEEITHECGDGFCLNPDPLTADVERAVVSADRGSNCRKKPDQVTLKVAQWRAKGGGFLPTGKTLQRGLAPERG